MRVIVKFDDREHPPLMRMFIHDAPHRRMHVKVIQQYREIIRAACNTANIVTPITVPIDLSVTFSNPSSPHLDNLLTALYQALDGNTLRGPGILEDDGLICGVRMTKYFPEGKKK